MASKLNVLPLASIGNIHTQKFLQDLRNLQVGRHGLRMSIANLVEAVEGAGGGVADLAVLYGVSVDQAQVLYDEATAFRGKLEANEVSAAWDKVNRVMGISV